MLSNFLLEVYKELVEVLGWLILIGAAIVGFIVGKHYGEVWDMQVVLPILGTVFGIIVGLLADAIFLPPLLILFKIYDRLGTITDRQF